MEFLYSDDSIVVVLKPAGVSSQASPGENMLSALSAAGMGECFPVHRLDTATSGVMVYARTRKACAALSREIAAGGLRKTYYAVVHGVPDPAEGEMEDLLYHDRVRNKSFVTDGKRNGVRAASLSYKTLSAGETGGKRYSVVEIHPHTGRTHQIRVQFASRGWPLAGDGKYGAKDAYRLKLFCAGLSFRHPDGSREMAFSVPCPYSLANGDGL